MNIINKKKGPLRTEVIVPITIILIFLTIYFNFFFDSHIKSGIEFFGIKTYRAEINVARVKTNFLNPSLSIYGIQITDKKKPDYNILEIEKVHLTLLWNALLRGKIVIPEASILQIKTNSKRRKIGRILPPEKRKTKGLVTKAVEKTLNQLKEKNQSNLLSDIFSIAGGENYTDQLKKLENDFNTQKKIKILKEDLKLKEKEWKKYIDELPSESEIKQLTKKMESIKIDFNKPETIEGSLKKINSLYKETQTKYKTIDNVKKTFKADINKYKLQYEELEKLIEKDINEVLKKLNIPSLTLDELNKMLLGNLVASQLKNLMKYKDMARKYLPNKTTQNSEFTPAERIKGIDYSFPKKKSYPRFWLKKVQVSSQYKNKEAGNLSGILKNLTNNPKLIGFPTTFDLKGSFPKDGITGISAHLNIDHSTSLEKESGFIYIESFPIKRGLLVQSKDVILGYEKTTGQSKIEFELKNEKIIFKSKNFFKDTNYFVKTRNKNLKTFLDETLKKLGTLDLTIQFSGSWSHFNLGINSNLAEALFKAIVSQVSDEITNLRKNMETQIKDLINKKKNELKRQIYQLETQWELLFKKSEKNIKVVETQIQKKKEKALKKETKKIEEKGKKELNKLLEKIKF